MSAHASGLRVGLLVSLFLDSYMLTGSIVMAGCKPPRRTDARGTIVS
jgi:hypothetical protein